MPSVIDLPIRESSSPRPTSYSADVSVTWPTFGYWVKAGAAFTLGAGTIGWALFVMAWLVFGGFAALILTALRGFR